ncbi:hypothetical protein BG262_02715 [Floricoccus penangensis]|uniref:Uncharacterized protein n=1 Tax=Floricoccus penangensis TaxID=1859475 RepID=A0A9Q5JGK0_9LACT|nr:hypothetical protein [Floricoccus penangensis]OFI46728.1 hypothetical protein BG262_02715 [Floricoccus penangensis]
MDFWDSLDKFNSLTGVIGFISTLLTLYLSFKTKRKLDIAKEETNFAHSKDEYYGTLSAIDTTLKNATSQNEVIKENSVVILFKTTAKFKGNYPITSKRKDIAKIVKNIEKFKGKQNIKYIDFIEPFEQFFAIFK